MKRCLGSGRISDPAGLEPATARSEVRGANHSATQRLLTFLRCSLDRCYGIYDDWSFLNFTEYVKGINVLQELMTHKFANNGPVLKAPAMPTESSIKLSINELHSD